VAKNLDELGNFTPLVLNVSGRDRVFDASLYMVAENFILDLLECRFDSLNLVEDIDAIAVLGDHAGDAADLAFDAAQPRGGRLLDSISHGDLYIPVSGISPAAGKQ